MGADAYIDVGPHNGEALREVGNGVILCGAPYSRRRGGTRAQTWTECEQRVLRDAADRGYEFQVSLPGLDQGSNRLDDPGPTDPVAGTVD